MSWPSLGLSLDTSALPEALDQLLRFRWQTPQLGPDALTVTCKPGQLPPRPQSAPQEITVSNACVPVWTAAAEEGTDELWLGEGLYLRLEDTEPGLHASVSVVPEQVTEAAWLLALVELQRLSGWLPLHAATVARLDRTDRGAGHQESVHQETGHSEAVSITGVSGAGKSTAALRLAGAGHTVLAEDQTWVHAASMRVTGLDRFLRTYADSLERFAPHLRAQAQGTDSYGKLLLPLTPPGELAQLTEAPQLRTLLVFGLPDTPTTAEKVRAVWECSGVPLLPRTRQSSAQAVSELMRQLNIQGTSRELVVPQVNGLLLPEHG